MTTGGSGVVHEPARTAAAVTIANAPVSYGAFEITVGRLDSRVHSHPRAASRRGSRKTFVP